MKKKILLCPFFLILTQCGEKDDKDKEPIAAATAKLQMEHSSGSGFQFNVADPTYQNPAKYTPSVFKIKILKVSIAQEKETTKYPASVLYIDSAACTPKDLSDQAEKYADDVPPEDRITYKYVGTEETCAADKTETFIDLAQSSSTVNAALNAQNLPVLPGKYKHVMLDLCFQSTDKKPNVSFKAEGMTSDQPLIKPGSCGWTSAEINPPLVVAKDSSVIINLNYNLKDMVLDYGPDTDYAPYTSGDNTNCFVSADKTVRRCIDSKLINITATVKAQ